MIGLGSDRYDAADKKWRENGDRRRSSFLVYEKGKYMNIPEELELTDEMLERIYKINKSVYRCLCICAEKKIPWDMEIIGTVAETIQSTLTEHGIKMRWPAIVTNDDGSQEFAE